MMSRALSAVAAMVILSGSPFAAAQAGPPADAWGPYRFLIGTWKGEGTGDPGTGEGTATFRLDLDDHILVRTATTHYPATAERPAFSHEDRMVIFRDGPGEPMRASYWDNEGHAIEYDVSPSADGKRVTFITNGTHDRPRFRLVYTNVDPSTVDVTFEIAPPDAPDGFKMYTKGRTKRAP